MKENYIALYSVLITTNLVELMYVELLILAQGIVFLLWSNHETQKGEGIGKEMLVENGIYAIYHSEFLGHSIPT